MSLNFSRATQKTSYHIAIIRPYQQSINGSNSTTKRERQMGWGDNSVVKLLVAKHEDLSSIPGSHVKRGYNSVFMGVFILIGHHKSYEQTIQQISTESENLESLNRQ